MKISFRLFLLSTALLLNLNISRAQSDILTRAYKEQAIESLSRLMNNHYVFPDVAKQTEVHLKTQLKEGYYDQFENDEDFAEALTTSVQSINKDKHMRIRANKQYVAPKQSTERMIEEQLDWIDRSRRENAGFNTVRILDGNVGYLDYRGFAGMEIAKPVIDAYMKLMSNTDAVIIDLSKNGGGSPATVQYLCSYFFDQKLHLNSLYWREGDATQEFWTLDEVGGSKMPDVPLFVITSNRTFSGAEEFSYNMQTQKRATLVGETTGGGANPGGGFNINPNLTVFIPTGRAINPITKTNWEGVGVIPEVQISSDGAFERAYDLAKQSAINYRVERNKKHRNMLMELHNSLDHYNNETSEATIYNGIKKCQEAGLLEEWDINALGYDYLMGRDQPKIAQCIFKANTMLYPNSANVFDSYAESLMANGDLDLSLKTYQKAVDVAIANGDGNVEVFRQNLEKAKQKLNTKE